MEYIRTHTVEFDTGPSCRLSVDSPSGATVVEGRDTERVRVQIIAHLWEESASDADDTMARVLRGVRHENASVRIEIPSLRSAGPWFFFGRGSRVDLQIEAPRDTAVRIASRSGRVEVVQVTGPVEIEQRSGRATVIGVRRNVQIASRSGAIEAEDIGGDVILRSRTGKVTVRRVAGDVTVQSRTGAVQVEGTDGDVDIESRTGRIVIERAQGDVRAVTTTGAISVAEAGGRVHLEATTGAVRYRGAVLGDIDIRVTTGAITLEIDPDRPFFLDAETVTGRIASDLRPRREGAPPAGAPSVRLRAVTGAITIKRLSP
ncbi:MAG TPA: DUF4097 family beta strand repeat-containing protein [Dehalococcoidia bacterium]|nr:DUF4097 family beta strand repeat-containing protein [Dehalococcoidia bacterium]